MGVPSFENRPAPRFRSSLNDVLLPGVRRVLTVPNPAAGSQWSFTVPGGRKWRILHGRATLVTSATVGNRNVALTINAAEGQLFSTGLQANQAASLSWNYYTPVGPFAVTANTVLGSVDMNWPQVWMQDGWVIGSTMLGVQAGDQWGPILFFIEELFEDDADIELHHQARKAAEAEALLAATLPPGG